MGYTWELRKSYSTKNVNRNLCCSQSKPKLFSMAVPTEECQKTVRINVHIADTQVPSRSPKVYFPTVRVTSSTDFVLLVLYLGERSL